MPRRIAARRLAASLALVLTAAACSRSDPGPGVVEGDGKARLVQIGTFDEPVHLTAPAGDRRVFVVEKSGRVIVLVNERPLAEPFLDLRGEVSTGFEQGLLSIAFHPDFDDNQLVYVDYTDRRGDTRVVEYRASGNAVDPASRRELLRVEQPYANHNGGLLVFDPDGMLIVGLGDGGAGGDPHDRAQDLSELLGKLLRIDPRPADGRPYDIPPDNPFVGTPGARPEIWAYGLRNPWRFWFDPGNGDLYLADVGQSQAEEVNVVARRAQPGANYGWPAFEGGVPFKERSIDDRRLVRPALTYGHGTGRCSITGGHVVVRGELAGTYLYGDYCEGEVLGAEAGDGRLGPERRLGFRVPDLTSFGHDADGRTYVLSGEGPVFRLDE